MKENLFLSEMHKPKPEYFSHGKCIHGYKVLDMDNTARNNYEYKSHMVYIMNEKPKLCIRGYHFCRELRDVFYYHYFKEECKIYHVIAFGDIDEDSNKSATNKIYIGDEIPLNIVFKQFNIGENNIGFDNVGNFNCGCGNKGDYNRGDSNFGDFNLGNANKGIFNIADRCVGSYNTASNTIGFFNTVFDTYNFNIFNRPLKVHTKETLNNIKFTLYHVQQVMSERNKDIFKNSPHTKPFFTTSSLLEKHKKILLSHDIESLPNFNPDIFFRCTGIKL